MVIEMNMASVLNSDKNEVMLSLLHSPDKIFNVCIMAHVDHGKTSLADSMIASNGIISRRLAGKVKYMDSRKDEIERGITMKSSCISLIYSKNKKNFLVNLIDSPGHVDFSSEVSTAVRLCDGTLIVIDVVEGLCVQTKVVLRQAWNENLKPTLVLNKIDRLITERKMTPLDAYYHISHILQQVNAFIGELFNTEVINLTDTASCNRTRTLSESFSGSEDIDDTNLYFLPEEGNVIFASALDGWGFSIHHFADQFSTKLGMSKATLQKTLFGDFYISSKGGIVKVLPGARDKHKSPLFVTLILENLYKVYDVTLNKKNNVEVEKIAKSIGVKMPLTIARSSDFRMKLQFLCSSWLPLSPALFDLIVDNLPPSNQISAKRAAKLMSSSNQEFHSLPLETQKLRQCFIDCKSDDATPVIVYVSKMFEVENVNLEKNHERGLLNSGTQPGLVSVEVLEERKKNINTIKNDLETAGIRSEEMETCTDVVTLPISNGIKEKECFLAFARVFSGSVRKGQKLYVLGPKHSPNNLLPSLEEGDLLPEEIIEKVDHIALCEVTGIYLLCGRDLGQLDEAPAGCVVGIKGFEKNIIKSATISSSPLCPAFAELSLQVMPILHVAVEPQDPRDLPKIRRGLKMLNQADPCVQVILQESGEYVLVTAGEVHLQRCVDDLEKYSQVPIHTSDPIIQFKETIIPPPTVDKLNEAIEGDNIIVKKVDSKGKAVGSTAVEVNSHHCQMRLKAIPMPPEVTLLLEKNEGLLKSFLSWKKTKADNQSDSDSSKIINEFNVKELKESLLMCDNSASDLEESINIFKSKLESAFNNAGAQWKGIIEQIWSFGPDSIGPNILVNRVGSYRRPSVWKEELLPTDSILSKYDASLVAGFQLATSAGPLCEEPMTGVAFSIDEWEITTFNECPTKSALSTGQVVSLAKDAFRQAFELNHQRLVCAMYSCVISVTSEVVGRLYSVIGRRHGRVVESEISEGSSSWNVTTYIPVVESMDFANELRKSTSGEAMPQLVFSHWEVLNIDPFWEPQTAEEIAHWGDKSDCGNRARTYINAIRKQKGLKTDNKVVEFAEKQRTLTKNK